MEKLGVGRSGVLAISLIILFVASVFLIVPGISNAASPGVTIKVGVIAPLDELIDLWTNLYKQIVEPDINAYIAKLPVTRFIPRVKFEFQIVGAGTGSAAEHFEKIKMFERKGVDLIIGGFMSSQIDQQTLDFLKKHNMVMISPSSNAPSLALADNLFRLLPDASMEGEIVAAMFTKLDLTTAIVVQRDDNWGNGIYQPFYNKFTGGLGAVDCYPYIPDVNVKTNFQNALIAANNKAHGLSKVGVFLIAADTDCADELNRGDFAFAYPNLAIIPWLGTDGTAFSTLLSEPNIGALKILSPAPATPHNKKFDDMKPRYEAAIGVPMDYVGSCCVDAGWILAQAIIETRSTSFWNAGDGSNVIKVLSDDCSRYFGYSGWCLLNQYGDRVGGDWEIWGYGLEAGSTVILQYGFYDSYSDTVSWIVTPTWP